MDSRIADLPSNYYNHDAIAASVANGEHRALIGGLWDEIGNLQIEFLRSKGLRRDNTLLDIGCGSLRLGVRAVAYLDPGLYWGTDINESLLQAGYDKEIIPANLGEKLPRSQLITDGKFNFSALPRRFDFAIAQSLFTHLPATYLRHCLTSLGSHLETPCTFFATFFIVSPDVANQPVVDPNFGRTTYRDRNPYHYSVSDLHQAAAETGWSVDFIGAWRHPRGQQIAAFTRLKDNRPFAFKPLGNEPRAQPSKGQRTPNTNGANQLTDMSARTLDFIIIGAEKSGTTLLVDLLRKSPDVAMPDHEVRYFRDPFYPDREAPEIYFQPADDSKLKGIKHPSYLGRPEVPDRIKSHSPRAKLIAILRDPVERMLSSYLHYLRHGQIPCIHPDVGIVLMLAKPDAFPKYRDIIAFGDYAPYLKMYLDRFDRSQLLFFRFEDFITSPRHLDELFAFLSVPQPAGLWPLPRSNEGNYDWNQCRQAYEDAKQRLIYDDFANIVGARPNVPPRHAGSSGAEGKFRLAGHVRELVTEFYAPSQRALADLKLLEPAA